MAEKICQEILHRSMIKPPNVTVSGKREFVALNIDRDLPSLFICWLSPLKVSENRKK